MSFILSKILWPFVAPGNVLVLLFLIAAFASVAQSEGGRQFGRRLGFVLALGLFLIAVLPVGEWLLTPLENRFPPERPERVDGIILLAGDESPGLTAARGQPVMLEAAARYIAFATLAREYPQARLAFVGGTNALNPITNVTNETIARQTLEGLGVAPERMTYEDASRNTYENAVFAAKLLKPQPEQNWLLVTSAFHVPRAMGCFRKGGFNVFPAPTAYRTPGTWASPIRFDLVDHLAEISTAVKEYVGLIAYRAMGRL